MKPDYKHIFHDRPTKTEAKLSLKAPTIVIGALGALLCLGLLLSVIPTKAHTINKSTSISANDISAQSKSFELPMPSNNQQQSNTGKHAISSENLSWKQMKVKSGDTFGQLAHQHGISFSEVHNLLNSHPDFTEVTRIHPGEVIKFRTNDDGQLLALQFDISDTERVLATRQADGSFTGGKTKKILEQRENRASGIIDNSFYGSALASGMSDNIIMQMADIFGYDIDFTLDIRKGDRFNVIWNEYYKDGVKIKDGDILAAEFTNSGRVIKAVRFTDENDQSNYFTPEGKSLKKAFIRNPVHFTRISSKFNLLRVHPLFKTVRPHRGVDYAAPTGTPIFASGDGEVIFRGKKRGYGNVVIIRHSGKKFTTLYGHMSKFNSKAKLNSYVKQGQTIGYVGKTGWATGPHLHYEFRVNGVHKNPLTVKLPTAEPIDKKYMASFKKQVDNLAKQLEVMDRTMLAQTQSKSAL